MSSKIKQIQSGKNFRKKYLTFKTKYVKNQNLL